MAKTVVKKYIPRVLSPNRPRLDGSPNPATPEIILKSTSGTAINFSRLMKMVPKGAIQSIVKELQPKELLTRAQSTPKNKPISIFQCKANFMLNISKFLLIVSGRPKPRRPLLLRWVLHVAPHRGHAYPYPLFPSAPLDRPNPIGLS